MLYRILFLIGLLFFLIGQVILAQGNEFVYQQKPIDFAHWFLLVGIVLLIPQVVSFPKTMISGLGIPLTLVGIICIIGMCVLDFIWWSFPDEAARAAFTKHITQVPSIWKTFVTIGPSSKIFNLGLLLLSFNYLKKGKVGLVIIALGTLVLWHVIPLPFRLIMGYALTLVGYSILFFQQEDNPVVPQV